MLRGELRDANLLADSIPARDGGGARIDRRAVDALAPTVLERLAGKPVVPPARLALRAVGAKPAVLPAHIRAAQCPRLEAILGSLLLSVGREIARGEELVHEALVLADAVAEHPAVVAIVIDAPLDVDDLARLVHGCGLVAPVV